MTRQERELNERFERIIRAIHELTRASPAGWVSWFRVAVQVDGAAATLELCRAVAELDPYRQYFVQTRNGANVRLSPTGVEYRLSTPDRSAASDPFAPESVADAIVGYAAKLHAICLRTEHAAKVAHVGARVVQAFGVETWDAQLPTGTPVTVRPSNGSPWTHGRIVGQDHDGGRVYVSADSEVPEEHLPAVLMIDRGFLLRELAEQIRKCDEVPKLASTLFGVPEPGHCVNAENAADAAEHFFCLERPWSRILWGPPGAGKTRCIAEFAARVLNEKPDSQLLLVAPSNLAVDVLVEETAKALERAGLGNLLRERQLLRFGYAVRVDRSELLGPETAEPLSRKIQQQRAKLARAERKDAPEERLADIRAQLLAAQEELMQVVRDHAGKVSVIATSTTAAYMPQNPIATLRPSYVVVDEATMVPPALCYYLASLATDGVLLAGDPRQLGPVIENPEDLNELGRLWMGRDVFEATSVSSGEGACRRVSERCSTLVRINEQRRCAEAIWELVEPLYPGVKTNLLTMAASDGADRRHLPDEAVLLFDTTGIAGKQPPCKVTGQSSENAESATLALEVAMAIAGEEPSRSVAIITPYRAQLRRLLRLLRQERAVCWRNQPRIEVGTVHQFQGSAADTVIFDVVDSAPKNRLGKLLVGDTGLRLVNVAVTRARWRLIVLADRSWHRRHCRTVNNSLLYRLIVDVDDESVWPVLPEGDRLESPPYESADEAVLGQAMQARPELAEVIPQHRIVREDGTLVSRADFAVPRLKYAIYVDGAAWHLSLSGWQRDRRLRTELRERGWEVTVFGAQDVRLRTNDCVEQIVETMARLRQESLSESGSDDLETDEQ